MDICSQMLYEQALNITEIDIQPVQVRPSFQWRLKYLRQYIPKSFSGDRFLNRFVDYPRYLKLKLPEYDLFHIADHSYAHLVHSLPAAKTGVFCHDLNAFQSILEPEKYPRSWGFQRMSKHILTGMQEGSNSILCNQRNSSADRTLSAHRSSKIGVCNFGASHQNIMPIRCLPILPSSSFSINYRANLLYCMSVVAYLAKELMSYWATFAQLRNDLPELCLVKVGGEWSTAQQEQITKLGLAESIVHLTNLHNATIAQLYQQAQIVLLTSEAEGFGMPLIEALACGAIVLATDLPVLRRSRRRCCHLLSAGRY